MCYEFAVSRTIDTGVNRIFRCPGQALAGSGRIGKAAQFRHVPNAVKGIDRAMDPLGETLGRGAVRMNLSQKTGLKTILQRLESVALFFHEGE